MIFFLNKKFMNQHAQPSTFQTYAVLALPLSFLGLPLYMHLPKFYHDHLSLAVASGIFLPLVSLGDDFPIAIVSQKKLTFMCAVVPLLLKCITIVFLSHRIHSKAGLFYEQN
jgi:hypothetical protein